MLYVLLFFNILFNFGGVEGRGSLAYWQICHPICPHTWQGHPSSSRIGAGEKGFGLVIGSVTGVCVLNNQFIWHGSQSRIWGSIGTEKYIFSQAQLSCTSSSKILQPCLLLTCKQVVLEEMASSQSSALASNPLWRAFLSCLAPCFCS